MRRFNEWVELLSQHGSHHGHLPADLAGALETLRFATRYELESPTPALQRRLQRLERDLPRQAIGREQIPRDLLKAIRAANRRQFPKKERFHGYRECYA